MILITGTLRNVGKAVDEAAKEMEESGLFEKIREIYFAHSVGEKNPKWIPVMDICKQVLREFRADDGVRAGAKWNEYY